MIQIQPITSSQSFQILIRETSSVAWTNYLMNIVSEDSLISSSIIPTASMNSNNFLEITASFPLVDTEFYWMRLYQMSGSVQVKQLYAGELLYSAISAYTSSTPEFITYTGSNTEYIIY
jgi:hypothetical protein